MDFLKYAKFSLESIKESMENYEEIPEVDSPFLNCSAAFSIKGSMTDRCGLNRRDQRLSINHLDDSMQSNNATLKSSQSIRMRQRAITQEDGSILLNSLT